MSWGGKLLHMKNHHAVTLGKKGGQIGGRSRSAAKIGAAKANGKKGGRRAKLIADSDARGAAAAVANIIEKNAPEVAKINAALRTLETELTAMTARAERAEAERDALAKDKARLDWLSVSDAWFDYPATGAFTPDTMRAAIDAAMKS